VAGEPRGKLLGKRVRERGASEWRTVIVRIGVQIMPQPERVLTSVWCSCRGSALEIHRREACERPVSLRFSALRPRVGTNRQCNACEGLVRSGKTGVSTALNAVRERSAVKVACSVLRGPRFRKGARLPTITFRTSEPTSVLALICLLASTMSAHVLTLDALAPAPMARASLVRQRHFRVRQAVSRGRRREM
jgi:hypothetical protein